MKNVLRAFAFSLVLTGAFASTHVASASAQHVTTAKMSAMPVPSCPPDDPNACGIGAFKWGGK